MASTHPIVEQPGILSQASARKAASGTELAERQARELQAACRRQDTSLVD